MNDEPKKKIIQISSVDGIKKHDEESGLDLLIGYKLVENVNGKDVAYTLWHNKQDTTQTKAYSQYKSQGLNIGSSVGIAYKEAPNNFKFKDRTTGEMKEAKSTNRTIMWFSEPNEIESYDETLNKLSSPAQSFSPNNEPIKDLGKEEEAIDVSKIPF